MSNHDLAEYLASDTDLPYKVWLQERDALARARVTKQPAPDGWPWPVTLLVAIVLATLLVTCCIVVTALLKGGQ